MECPNCHSPVEEGSLFCGQCGYALRSTSAPGGGQTQPLPGADRVGAPHQVVYARPAKDPSLALILEIVGTLLGFMGIGWMYAGWTSRGIVMLLLYLLWEVVAAVISVATAGIFACVWLPVQITAAVVSGLQVKKAVEQGLAPK